MNILGEENFIFTAKEETIRDLFMFPKPQWHLSNRQLVKEPVLRATVTLTTAKCYIGKNKIDSELNKHLGQ